MTGQLTFSTMRHGSTLFYHILPTPFGEAAIIHRKNPFLTIRIVLPLTDRKNFAGLLDSKGWRKSDSHQKALIISESVIDYFIGKPIQPPWEWMDLGGFTALQRSVFTAVADIPYGQLRSYKEIAKAIGRPRAYRFVGTTLANNRFPLLIPCHRVIKSDSSIGQFGGGIDLKRKLIDLESSFSIQV